MYTGQGEEEEEEEEGVIVVERQSCHQVNLYGNGEVSNGVRSVTC